MLRELLAAAVAMSFTGMAWAGVKTEAIEYRDGETVLAGSVSYADTANEPRPAVLVVHDWLGHGDFGISRAEKLAEMGYVAICVDIYGKGVRPTGPEEAAPLAGKFKADRALLRRRVMAGYDFAKTHPRVDATRIAALGFCFGGTTALELARSGADLKGVISFHGGLDSPTPQDAKQIRGKVLVLHGADDPFVPPAEVNAFLAEMKNAQVDYQFVAYGNAVHSFTNPAAGDDASKGFAFNPVVDRRATWAMTQFLAEIFDR